MLSHCVSFAALRRSFRAAPRRSARARPLERLRHAAWGVDRLEKTLAARRDETDSARPIPLFPLDMTGRLKAAYSRQWLPLADALAASSKKRAEKEATLKEKLKSRKVVKHPDVEKPDDFKPYVPPAPKEKKEKKRKVSDETRKRKDRERVRKKQKEYDDRRKARAEVDAWAQCDACQKWRVLPKGHVVDEGAAWTCATVGRSCDERADDADEAA